MLHIVRRKKWFSRAQANPADTRIDVATISNGEINDVAINEMTATTKTIQAFASETARMSRQALDRTTRHIERLRKAHSMEEVASIQMDFAKESLEHAEQHSQKLCEMLAAFPLKMAKTYQDDWLQLITGGTDDRGSRHAVAARVVPLWLRSAHY